MRTPRRSLEQKVIYTVLALGFVVFVVYFVLFINPGQVACILSKTNLTYYACAFAAYSFYAFFSSLVWRSLLSKLQIGVSIRKALLFTWVGLFFDATVPQLGWSAEVSKTYLLAKDSSLEAGKIGASVVGQKIFNMTATVVAMSLGFGFVVGSYSLPLTVTLLILLVLGLSIVALVLVYFVSIKDSVTKTLLSWAIRLVLLFRRKWNPDGFRQKAEKLLGTFHASVQELRTNSKKLVKPIAYSVTSFVFEISVTFITFVALGYAVPIDKVLIVFTLTGVVQTAGVTFFGFPELIMSVTFTALGISAALSVSVTLLVRIVSLWFRLGVSYAALQWTGLRILTSK